jgi:hypothetical protein
MKTWYRQIWANEEERNKKNVKIKEKKEWHSNDEGHEETKRRTTKKIQSKTNNKNKQTNVENQCIL